MDLQFFDEKTSSSSTRRTSGHLWEVLLAFQEKIFWPSTGRPSLFLREDLLSFYEKNFGPSRLWLSMRDLPVFWSSMRRQSGLLWEDIPSSLRWEHVHFGLIWEDFHVYYEYEKMRCSFMRKIVVQWQHLFVEFQWLKNNHLFRVTLAFKIAWVSSLICKQQRLSKYC